VVLLLVGFFSNLKSPDRGPPLHQKVRKTAYVICPPTRAAWLI